MASAPRRALPWLAGGAAAQLVLLGLASPAGALRNTLACALVLALPIAASHAPGRTWRAWRVMAVTGALGGLGMLAGALLDARSSGLPACHAGGSGLASWMNAGMLAGCLPACLWLSPDCRSTARWPQHAGCLAGMMAGMLAGGRWLAPMLGAMVTAPAIHHIAMVLGMMLGAAVGYQAMHREAALAPPGSSSPATADRHAGRAAIPPRATAQLRGASEP